LVPASCWLARRSMATLGWSNPSIDLFYNLHLSPPVE
jgi:hypothetical protein